MLKIGLSLGLKQAVNYCTLISVHCLCDRAYFFFFFSFNCNLTLSFHLHSLYVLKIDERYDFDSARSHRGGLGEMRLPERGVIRRQMLSPQSKPPRGKTQLSGAWDDPSGRCTHQNQAQDNPVSGVGEGGSLKVSIYICPK